MIIMMKPAQSRNQWRPLILRILNQRSATSFKSIVQKVNIYKCNLNKQASLHITIGIYIFFHSNESSNVNRPTSCSRIKSQENFILKDVVIRTLERHTHPEFCLTIIAKHIEGITIDWANISHKLSRCWSGVLMSWSH